MRPDPNDNRGLGISEGMYTKSADRWSYAVSSPHDPHEVRRLTLVIDTPLLGEWKLLWSAYGHTKESYGEVTAVKLIYTDYSGRYPMPKNIPESFSWESPP